MIICICILLNKNDHMVTNTPVTGRHYQDNTLNSPLISNVSCKAAFSPLDIVISQRQAWESMSCVNFLSFSYLKEINIHCGYLMPTE